MPIWAIRSFRAQGGRKVFLEEYKCQSPAVRADFRSLLTVLREQPLITGWCRPNFDRLSRRFRELGKLRLKVQNVQHRPLGFFGPTPRTFTLLAWATERDGDYDPPNVREVALKRMSLVINNPELADDSDF